MKPVLMISDLPAWGRVALALGIPVLEKAGIQTCCLPTALLSTHGAYAGAVVQAQTDFLAKALSHLASLELEFSALYSGFISEAAQFELLLPLVRSQSAKGALGLVDPIMGDNGTLYGFFDQAFVGQMRCLLADADIITPNITEATFLFGHDPTTPPATEPELKT